MSYCISEDAIMNNWKTFRRLCSKTGDRSDAITAMVDELEDRAALAPASSKGSYHAAYPGGLVDHSLRVLKNARKMHEMFKDFYGDIPLESVIVACLFHDWGKIGDVGEDPANDYYIAQDNAWRRDNLDEMYKINWDLTYFKNSARAMYILQYYDIKLTEAEWLSIYLNDGPMEEKNRPYAMKEPRLATLVQQADYLAACMEKAAADEA